MKHANCGRLYYLYIIYGLRRENPDSREDRTAEHWPKVLLPAAQAAREDQTDSRHMRLLNASLLHCVLIIAALLAQPAERASAKAAAGADQDGAEAGADDDN